MWGVLSVVTRQCLKRRGIVRKRKEKKKKKKIMQKPTCLAVGWIKSLLTVLAVFVTVDVNQPKPLLSAATGSFCSSSSPGRAAASLLLPAAAAGAGVFPNPAYLPP